MRIKISRRKWIKPIVLVILTTNLPAKAVTGYGEVINKRKRNFFFRWDIFQKVHRR